MNELVAYKKLGNIIDFRDAIIKNGTFDLYKNGTLPLPTGNDFSMIWNVCFEEFIFQNQ